MKALLVLSGGSALGSLACSPVLAEAIIKPVGGSAELAWAYLAGSLVLSCITVFAYGWSELS